MTDSGTDQQLRAQRNQVEAMAGFGIPETDIAKVLKIEPEALRALNGGPIETAPVDTYRLAHALLNLFHRNE
jgi:hypothetical protein